MHHGEKNKTKQTRASLDNKTYPGKQHLETAGKGDGNRVVMFV